MNILGTGMSGLVGSRIIELNPDFKFTDLSLDTGYNILKPETLKNIFANFDGDTVLHLAAFTDTNAAWSQQNDLTGPCYQINVIGTQNIVDLCHQYHKHLIHISTDFVFDGSKKDPYLEDDLPHPLDWYGQTKYLAEKNASTIDASIVRLAFPYRARFEIKPDLVQKIITKLKNKETITMFTDQITTPTFIDDIAIGIRKLIDSKPKGIYHLVGSSSQSPYNMAKLIALVFDLNSDLIKPSLLSDYLKTPEARPYAPNLALSNQKLISEFGFTPKTLKEGLIEMKRQLSLPL